MERRTSESLKEFQNLVSKMSLDVCCQVVLPELGTKWSDVARAIRKNRLPMTSASVGKVLRWYMSQAMPDGVDELLGQLRIHLVATSAGRVWHGIKLVYPTAAPEPAAVWIRLLPSRVMKAARASMRGMNCFVEVHTAKLGNFIFLSVERITNNKRGAPLYVAVTASEPVAFVTSLGSKALIQAVVQGLGYKTYTDANLYGKDLTSLLRIIDRTLNVNVNLLTDIPEYNPQPIITNNCIDYTNKGYNETYVDNLIGPDPPLINNLDVKSEKMFFDPSRLNKKISVSLVLKSENVASTLKSWVAIKAIPPTSEFIKIFHKIKTNKITYDYENEE